MNSTVMPRIRELSDWICQFADQNYHLFAPSTLQVRQAIAAYLPEQLLKYSPSAEAEGLLEEVLGIAIIIRLGDRQIALSIAEDRAKANALQQTYSAAPYSAIRADLGINSQWILLVNPDLLFTVQDMYEAHLDLMELEIQPECLVMPV